MSPADPLQTIATCAKLECEMAYQVEFEEEQPPKELESSEECLSLARAIHDTARSPVGACFHHPNGESLLVVLGATVSAACHFPADYAETAVGSMSTAGDGRLIAPLDYWLCGHHSQVAPENAIDVSTMFSALEYYLERGGRSGDVNWVPD